MSALLALLAASALAPTTPKLHVEGRFLIDANHRNVTLHGYMQPGGSWFNGESRNYPDPKDYTTAEGVAPALKYFKCVADIMTDHGPRFGKDHGWFCTYVRYIADGNVGPNFGPGWDAQGALAKPGQFKGWIENLLVPYAKHCRQRGLYVVLVGNPSEVFPNGKDGKPDSTKNMTRQYQENLIAFWKEVASHPAIKGADNVQFEICNEPIAIESSFGANDWRSGNDASWAALTAFMQPVVNAIRSTGADNVIWVPGLGWQGEAQGWAKYPIKGRNIGYSAHFYPAYGGVKDDAAAVKRQWESNYKPAADIAPMLLSEMFWNPNSGEGYQGLWNAHTDGFGTAIKAIVDAQGNVSFNLGMIGDMLSNLQAGLGNVTFPTSEAAQAAWEWYPKYWRN